MWQGSPFLRAQRGHRNWSLDWVGNSNILEIQTGIETFKGEKYVTGSKNVREKPSKPFDIGHRATGFLVFPTRFSCCFVKYFSTMPPFLTFWLLMHILYYCLLKVYNFLFALAGGLQLGNCFESQKKKNLSVKLCGDYEKLWNIWSWTKCIFIMMWLPTCEGQGIEYISFNENDPLMFIYLDA